VPQATLVRANLLDEWPISFQQRFDRVVSAYVLHESALDTRVKLLKRIATDRLSPGGRILIADIAFPTTSARAEASQRWAASWDEDECYWAADEATAACNEAGLLATYRQLSACGGVFVFTLDQSG
jgi:cyclopropane fatty-acyl-phospholipid synthase-like methyltransferase